MSELHEAREVSRIKLVWLLSFVQSSVTASGKPPVNTVPLWAGFGASPTGIYALFFQCLIAVPSHSRLKPNLLQGGHPVLGFGADPGRSTLSGIC